jgi:hypothetical protein
MDTVTIMRIVGLGVTVIVFAVVVALMPRIFGEKAPVDLASGEKAPAPPAPAGGAPAAAPAVTPPAAARVQS